MIQNEELTLTVLRNIDAIKSQKSFAKKLGCSVGKTNYVLKALIEKGFIKADNFFANKNKNQYRYLLTEKGIREKVELTKKFIQKKKTEYIKLQQELEMMTDETGDES